MYNGEGYPCAKGAGKTTFVKLLLRLFKPTKGEITLNGINIWDYKSVVNNRMFFMIV